MTRARGRTVDVNVVVRCSVKGDVSRIENSSTSNGTSRIDCASCRICGNGADGACAAKSASIERE